jgi:hypothetical protein
MNAAWLRIVSEAVSAKCRSSSAPEGLHLMGWTLLLGDAVLVPCLNTPPCCWPR